MVIAESSGKVLACHCNCMAGLGETCSHVASFLWAVEAGGRMRDSMTVTQKKAYWVLLPSVKEVPYAPLSHINFLRYSVPRRLEGWKRLHEARARVSTHHLHPSNNKKDTLAVILF